jgi:hypothetical protein
MSTPEKIILDNLNVFQKEESDKHFRVALKTLETSKHRIDFSMLDKEIKLHGLQKEWKLLKDIEFAQLINF